MSSDPNRMSQCAGRYFMTQEKEDEVAGKVGREKKAAERHLAALQAEATSLGRELQRLGRFASAKSRIGPF
jgi:hypothetical protein